MIDKSTGKSYYNSKNIIERKNQSIGFLLRLIIRGCDKTEETKILTCTLDNEVTSNVNMENTYKATYKGENVELIETIEKVISDNATYLETVKEQVEAIYEPFKDVKYYEYDVKIDGNTLLSTTKIDYSKIDYNELLKVNSQIASIMKDGKLKIKDLKEIYTKLGAECK